MFAGFAKNVFIILILLIPNCPHIRFCLLGCNISRFRFFFLVLILLCPNCPLIVSEQVWRKTSNLGLRVQNVDKLTRLDAKLWPFAISRFVCILSPNCLLIVPEQVRIPCVLEHHEGMINDYEHHQAFAHLWSSCWYTLKLRLGSYEISILFSTKFSKGDPIHFEIDDGHFVDHCN